ncbi:MAG: C40 family peptidase [Rhodococcus sp.]|nr:C40 family peptidase [Rhodococcus sp. (in: high G+C Gram-positive bacteria)]
MPGRRDRGRATVRTFGFRGGIRRDHAPAASTRTFAGPAAPGGGTSVRRARSRAPRWFVGIGLLTVVAVGLGSTAAAAPPVNPSDAELEAADSAVDAGLDRVGRLVLEIAGADQQLAELDDQVAIKREDVNRALVDLQNARTAADAAAAAVVESERALRDAGHRISDAQHDFDGFARDSYVRGVNGASLGMFLATDGPGDLLDRAQVMRLLSSGRQAVLDALERARTAEVNSNSRARAAKVAADEAAAAAEQRRADAEAAIAVARAALDAQAAEKQRIEQERARAQDELAAARTTVAGLADQRAEFVAWEEQRRAQEAAEAAAADAARAAAAEAAVRVAADAAARARAAELADGRRAHTELEAPDPPATPSIGGTAPVDTGADPTTEDAGGADDGILVPDIELELDFDRRGSDGPGTRTGPHSTPRTTPRPTLTGAAAIETVIDRGMSQIGVPYAWGGGDENGPTLGIRDGGVADTYRDFEKVGFDCSGLMIYAFAGIGISLPHYTGYQYTAGTQIPSAEMKRGDMIFYGPNASRHVALYLGDGTMLEAPQSGSHVKISPVRWDGMTPYVVRMVS